MSPLAVPPEERKKRERHFSSEVINSPVKPQSVVEVMVMDIVTFEKILISLLLFYKLTLRRELQ